MNEPKELEAQTVVAILTAFRNHDHWTAVEIMTELEPTQMLQLVTSLAAYTNAILDLRCADGGMDPDEFLQALALDMVGH